MNEVFFRRFIVFVAAFTAVNAQAQTYQCTKLTPMISPQPPAMVGVVSTEGHYAHGVVALGSAEFPFEGELYAGEGSWKGTWRIIPGGVIPDFPAPLNGALTFTEVGDTQTGILVAHAGTTSSAGFCRRVGGETKPVPQAQPASQPSDAQVSQARSYLAREWEHLSRENRSKLISGAALATASVEMLRWSLAARAGASAAAEIGAAARTRMFWVVVAAVANSLHDSSEDSLPSRFYFTEAGVNTLIHYNDASYAYFTQTYPWLKGYIVALAAEAKKLS